MYQKRSDRLQCKYCGKHGHGEHSFYSTQADEIAKKHNQVSESSSSKVLHKDDKARQESNKPLMYRE